VALHAFQPVVAAALVHAFISHLAQYFPI